MPSLTPSRREILAATAWAAPTIVMARAVPAVVTSPPTGSLIAVPSCSGVTSVLTIGWADPSNPLPLPAGNYIFTATDAPIQAPYFTVSANVSSYFSPAGEGGTSATVTLPDGHSVTSFQALHGFKTGSPQPTSILNVAMPDGGTGSANLYDCVFP